MRSTLLWKDSLRDRATRGAICITDVVFSPDGSQLLAASGRQIHVYSAYDGSFSQPLTGHKDTVTSLAFAGHGKKFASGGADKTVIIWNTSLSGLLKFQHNDGIRCMQFNPITHQLATCTSRDFGFWSEDLKQVPKYTVDSPITSCSWTSDGYNLVLGFGNGEIGIYNRNGVELERIIRPEKRKVSIISLACSPKREEDVDIIAVVDQNQSLSFFDTAGKQISKDKSLGFDALTVNFTHSGEYLLIAGSNKQSALYTKDGIFINSIGELSSWVFCCRGNPSGTHVAVGSEDGEVAVYELLFSTVHSLYREHYAYRNSMTDVIIQHLMTEEKVRIKCRDLVKKLAIYRDRLAIQLSDKIVIYELTSDNESPKRGSRMHYKVRDKINHKSDCTLLVVGANGVILSSEKRLMYLNFQGDMEREWLLESFIRYVRATGGPAGREGILLGLRNGQVLQIFVNNPFPVTVLQLNSPVRCLDLSIRRKKLALVDDQGTCSIYDVKTRNLVQKVSSDRTANSVTWNSQLEEMLAFSGSGSVCVQAEDFTVYQQPLQGFVVGFVGAKVFCLQQNTVTAIEVSQTQFMKKYINMNRFEDAFEIACLNATDSDWSELAHAALESMDLTIAKKAFSRIADFPHLDLIHSFELSTDKSKHAELSFLGDVMAFKGKYTESVKLYKQAGHDEKAINMFTDLKMFDQAQDLIRSGDSNFKKQLAMKKAAWVENINEPRAAAEMYLMAGEMKRAIDIIGQHAWIDMLMNVVRSLDKGDRENLTACAQYLVQHKQYFNAAEVYRKIGDIRSLAGVFVKSCQWEEAFTLCNEYPDMTDLKKEVYGPYAEHLAEQDRFTDAQAAFHKAGLVREALQVLQQLTTNAIEENRFRDAGYYSWVLSNQCLELIGSSQNDKLVTAHLSKYRELQRMADIYYAYEKIYRFIEEPFTSCFPDTLFNMARFLFHEMMRPGVGDSLPQGVSRVIILYALAKQCRNLGAYKLARVVYEKLQTLHIPPRFVTSIEMGDLTSRAKPFSDAEDLLPLCYRCSTTNPLINPKGMQCINCQQPFILSFASFDVLPVVEFSLEEGITHEEAIKLIHDAPEEVKHKPASATKKERWQEELSDQYQTLKIGNDAEDDFDVDQELGQYYSSDEYAGAGKKRSDGDPFTLTMGRVGAERSVGAQRIIVGRSVLKQLKTSEVLIANHATPLKPSYYRNLVPDMNVTMCSGCHRFFMEDFEASALLEGCCPFCRRNDDITT